MLHYQAKAVIIVMPVAAAIASSYMASVAPLFFSHKPVSAASGSICGPRAEMAKYRACQAALNVDGRSERHQESILRREAGQQLSELLQAHSDVGPSRRAHHRRGASSRKWAPSRHHNDEAGAGAASSPLCIKMKRQRRSNDGEFRDFRCLLVS